MLCFALTAILMMDRPEPGLGFLPPALSQPNLEQEETLRLALYQVLFDQGIRAEWITGDHEKKHVRIPRNVSMVEPYAALAVRFQELGGELLAAAVEPSGAKMLLQVGLERRPIIDVTLQRDLALSLNGGCIAVVIDDFGYSFNGVVKEFLTLKHTITFSILPGLKYSTAIANAAFEQKREVMLHLPMEPRNGKIDHDQFVLLTNMNEQEIRARVRRAISAIPHAIGLNNHMGSLATENEALLSIMMDEIKKSGLFFLDSRTDPKTRAYAWSKKLDIPTAINDVFLDANYEEDFIRSQVRSAAEIAARKGSAIVIGHPEELTLKVLREELLELEKRGFLFVNVSDVVK